MTWRPKGMVSRMSLATMGVHQGGFGDARLCTLSTTASKRTAVQARGQMHSEASNAAPHALTACMRSRSGR